MPRATGPMQFEHKPVTAGVDASRVHLVLQTRNIKLGPIPTSTTTAVTCPDACPLKAKGCYAKSGPMAMHWRNVTENGAGTPWAEFTAKIANLPPGTFWRHNQAGDLPGLNNEIDATALRALVSANDGRRGFTYTHKPMTSAKNRRAVAQANAGGFTVNLSADTLAEADELSELGIAPVVVILDSPEGERRDTVTPGGRAVATCPATYRDDVTCATCQLCQRQGRKVIVGFPAHGNGRKAAAAVARGGVI
jgi:hypothetical protein